MRRPQNVTQRLQLLFICSRNQWRSPTAEAIWRHHPHYAVRSAGVSPKARRRVGPADLRWADIIFVMEKRHRDRLRAEFGHLLTHTPVHVLGIPDIYPYGDPALIAELEAGVARYLATRPPDSDAEA